MKSCCKSAKKDKQCIRKSDGKIFKLPRRFSKRRCMEGVKGFTMRSSCAPYKGCISKRTKRGGSKRLTYRKNILGKPIQKCSVRPLTGFYRDGYCMTGPEDLGTHTVCAKMDRRFLDFTAKQGNDLSSVVTPGDSWCLCQDRYLESYKHGYAPKVIKSATNMRTKAKIRKLINKQKGGTSKTKKKQFLFNPDSPKKSFDVYIDKDSTDTIPIKYTRVKDVKQTIKKLERLYKKGKYPHKRIWQVGMIMYVRLKVLKKKKKQQYNLAKKYFEFLGKRTDIKNETDRKKYKFNI